METTVQVHRMVFTVDLHCLQRSPTVSVCCHPCPGLFPANSVLELMHMKCYTIPLITSANCMLMLCHSGIQASCDLVNVRISVHTLCTLLPSDFLYVFGNHKPGNPR